MGLLKSDDERRIERWLHVRILLVVFFRQKNTGPRYAQHVFQPAAHKGVMIALRRGQTQQGFSMI